MHTHVKVVRLALVLALAGFGLSCGGGGGGPVAPPADTTAPTVTATTPDQSATSVATNSTVTATFSEAIDPATVTTATFTLGGGSGAVTGSVSASGAIATFTPAADLAYDTNYTATVTTGVKDAAGNALASARTWTFTTVPAPDTTAPTVVTTDPASDATNVAVSSAVTVTFSEAIDLATLTIATFTLVGGSGAVDGVVDASGPDAAFTPNALLAYNTTYTATLTTDVSDIAGNPLATEYSWSFTTELDPAEVGVEIRNVDIAGQGTSATLSAGQPFSLEFDFVLWNAASCPRCQAQIVIGIEGDAQDCVYDTIPEEFPGDGGQATLNLTAPSTPGVYAIRYQHDDQPSCADALTNYDNDPPSGNVIGTVTVTSVGAKRAANR